MFRASGLKHGTHLVERLASTRRPSSTPVTYSVGGQQYVAVVAGGGGAHDITWAALTPEIDSPAGSPSLWVFKLPKAARKAP